MSAGEAKPAGAGRTDASQGLAGASAPRRSPEGRADAAVSPRPEGECAYDIVSLGEVMLRLDPGEGRIRTARSFAVCEGGGEYNVARGLRRCFGERGAIVTALVRDEVGRLVEDLMLASGLDTRFVQWVPSDGVGRSVRNGLNFTERGFGIRGAVGCSDRGHTAVSQMRPDAVDWDRLFGELGVRWLHTGGIFAALSDASAEVARAAMEAARRHGTLVSYDLNYRPSLWRSNGGRARAREVNRELAGLVDVMIGNEEDFTACLGFEVPGNSESLDQLNLEGYQEMLRRGAAEFPNWKVVATTLRTVHSATVNDWKAICFADGALAFSRGYEAMEVLDRVGGGDSFASGLIYGLMATGDPKKAVEYGAAHGALAMTTPGDTSMASVDEVEALMAGKGARVKR